MHIDSTELGGPYQTAHGMDLEYPNLFKKGAAIFLYTALRLLDEKWLTGTE
jgi:hypothetical protein